MLVNTSDGCFSLMYFVNFLFQKRKFLNCWVDSFILHTTLSFVLVMPGHSNIFYLFCRYVVTDKSKGSTGYQHTKRLG